MKSCGVSSKLAVKRVYFLIASLTPVICHLNFYKWWSCSRKECQKLCLHCCLLKILGKIARETYRLNLKRQIVPLSWCLQAVCPQVILTIKLTWFEHHITCLALMCCSTVSMSMLMSVCGCRLLWETVTSCWTPTTRPTICLMENTALRAWDRPDLTPKTLSLC